MPFNRQRLRFIRPALWALTGVYWCGIFVMTHLPPADVPSTGVSDKTEHFGAYGLLGGALYLALWATWPHRRGIPLIVLAVGLAYGAVDEWLQIPVGRSCECADWCADATGLVIAVGAMSLIRLAVDRFRTKFGAVAPR